MEVTIQPNTPMDRRETRRLALKDLVDSLGRGGVAAVAAQIGKAPDYVSRMLYEPGKPGRKGIGEDTWDALIAAYPKELKPGKPDVGVREPVALYEIAPSHVRFPLLEGFAGMGRGDYVGDYPEIVDWIEVTREWAGQKLRGVPLEAIRVITGRGDSMRGQYNDGDLVFVDSRVKRFDADSAYCYRWHGQVQIKRLQLIGKGMVRIISKNPDYQPVDVAIDELEIGGRAIAAWTLTEF